MNDREQDLGLSRRGAAQLAHWSEPLVLATNLTVEIPYESYGILSDFFSTPQTSFLSIEVTLGPMMPK